MKKKKNLGTKSPKSQKPKIALEMQETRAKALFFRTSLENFEFLKKEASANKCSMSYYVDALISRAARG